MNKKVKFSGLWTAILSVVSVAYIFPILLVLINSFKKKAYISRYPFAIPTDKMFVGLENYVNGLTKTGFFQAFGWTLFITVFSVEKEEVTRKGANKDKRKRPENLIIQEIDADMTDRKSTRLNSSHRT